MQSPLLIGLGAGIASAALFASAWTGTALGVFVLFFLSPLPVAIAGLGWNWISGVLAAATGTAIVAAAGGPRSGIVYAIALAAPAAAFAYLAKLNRPSSAPPNANGDAAAAASVEWYPIGRIIAWASLWAGLTAAAFLLSIGNDVASVRATLLDVLEKSLFSEEIGPGGRKLTAEEKNAFVAVMVVFFPWAVSTLWFAVAMLNLWVAGHVTHLSGRLVRPWPHLHQIQLPPVMPPAFGAAVLGTFVPGMTGLIASGFASALMFAFMLVGLAILHRVTRGNPLRPLMLGAVYGALLLLSPFSSLLIALIGLAEPYLRRRVPPGAPPPPLST